MTVAEILETVESLTRMMKERKDIYINVFMSEHGASISIYPMEGDADNGQETGDHKGV